MKALLIYIVYSQYDSKKIRRKYYLDKLLPYKNKDIIKVVTGLHRSGKSVLLQIFRNDLSKEEVSDK